MEMINWFQIVHIHYMGFQKPILGWNVTYGHSLNFILFYLNFIPHFHHLFSRVSTNLFLMIMKYFVQIISDWMFSVLFPFILKFAVCTLQTELTGTSDRNRKRLPAYQLTLIQQQQHLSNKHSFIARFKKLEKAR